jgi:Voltage-dependent anion channel
MYVYSLSTREASPILFSITMGRLFNFRVIYSNRLNFHIYIFTGTGKISILFFAFPFATGAQPMIVLSLIFFFLGLFLFCSFVIILGLKYIYYPDRWSSMLRNPTAIMYAGCLPMGAATLINVCVVVINGQLNFGGKSFLYFIWAIWWIDVLISFLSCWVGVHTMYVSGLVFFSLCTQVLTLPD